MAEGAVVPAELLTGPVVGRSLWADARVRLVRNRAALISIIVLSFVAVACVFGPFVTGHPFDRVYPDYVRAPASLSAYPTPEQVEPAIERIGARIRAKAQNVDIGYDSIRMNLVGERPIDERLLAYFERSDLFGTAKVVERLDEGRNLLIEVPVKRVRFLFGTDANGRDLLTRTMKAGQISLAIGLLATFVSILIGVTYGATSGYLGGRVDMIMMRIVDVLYSLPFIFFVIMLVVFFGRNFILMFIAVGAVEWLDMARIVRGQALALKQREFVEAAHALGVGPWGVLRRHIIPNTLGPVAIFATLMVPKVILLESFLSFLGLGVQEPLTSWGVLISDGAANIQSASYLLIFPSIFFVATLFCLNFIGDGLRDALDPKDR